MVPWKYIGVTALVAVSVWAGFFLSLATYQKAVVAALALVIGLLMMSLQTGNQFLGLAVLVVTAVVAPVQFGGSERAPLNSAFFLAAFICGMWLLSTMLLRRTGALESGRLAYAALAFMACVTISFAVNQFPQFSHLSAPLGAQVAQLAIFLLSAGLFLIVPDLIRDAVQLKRLTWLFIGAGAVTCVVVELGGRLFGSALGLMARVTHPETIGSVFWTWLVAMTLSQALFNRELRALTRASLFALAALTLIRGLVLARSWTSGWLPPLAVLCLLLLFRLPRVGMIAAVLVVLAALYIVPGMNEVTPQDEEYSASTRLAAARVIWPLIQAHPVLGLGPANYYYQVSTLPILGWYVRFNSHNQYIDLAAQLGFLGLGVFAWLVCEMAASAWRLRKNFHGDFCEAYLLGALSGLAGTVLSGGLADWILPFYYNIGIGGLRSSLLFWVFIGGVVVLERVNRESASVAGRTAPGVFASTGRLNWQETF